MELFPKDYEKQSKEDGYLKPSDGDCKIRFMGKGIVGWEQWTTDNKPVRGKALKDIVGDFPKENKFGEECKPKDFFSTVVWNVNEKKIQIFTITQTTIKSALMSYESNNEYGDPTGYDLSISMQADGKGYSVIASPPKEVSKEAIKEYDKSNIDLEQLFTGDNPFNAKSNDDVDLGSVPF